MIDIINVSKSFGGITALSGVSFTIAPGTIHGLIGPNGSGKTTLLNVISGLEIPTAGRVLHKGTVISAHPPHRIAARGLVRTFQNIRLLENLSVEANLAIGCYRRSRPLLTRLTRRRRWGAYLSARDESLIAEVLDSLGITHLRSRRAGEASLAEKRKVEIARALCAEPEVVLLDEPIAGMHPVEKKEVAEIIRKIKAAGVTVLLVDHDMATVMSLCDTITVLNFGQRIASGPPGAIQADPAVIDAYLGTDDA